MAELIKGLKDITKSDERSNESKQVSTKDLLTIVMDAFDKKAVMRIMKEAEFPSKDGSFLHMFLGALSRIVSSQNNYIASAISMLPLGDKSLLIDAAKIHIAATLVPTYDTGNKLFCEYLEKIYSPDVIELVKAWSNLVRIPKDTSAEDQEKKANELMNVMRRLGYVKEQQQ